MMAEGYPFTRTGGYDHYPAAIVGISKEPWNYAWNGDWELPRFDLYRRRVAWNRAEAHKRALALMEFVETHGKGWALFLIGTRTASAFGITRPFQWFEWYRCAAWGPLIPVPLNTVPSLSEQMHLTAIAEGRLPLMGNEVQA